MQQFYVAKIPEDASKSSRVNFVQPVRKMLVEADSEARIWLLFDTETTATSRSSPEFRIYAKTPVYLDFQSANNGGGVSSIMIGGLGDTSAFLRISVIEYGTGGNNEWYK